MNGFGRERFHSRTDSQPNGFTEDSRRNPSPGWTIPQKSVRSCGGKSRSHSAVGMRSLASRCRGIVFIPWFPDPSFRLRAWLSRDRASLLRSSPYSRSGIRSEFLISNLKFLTAVGAAGKEVRRFFRGSPGVPYHFAVMRREPYFHYGFLGGKPERLKRRAKT